MRGNPPSKIVEFGFEGWVFIRHNIYELGGQKYH